MHATTLALFFALLPQGEPPALPFEEPPSLAPMVERFETDARGLERFWSLELSEARLERLDRLEAEWLALLARSDFTALSQAQRIDWLLLANHLVARGEERALWRGRMAEMAPLLPFREGIVALVEAQDHGAEPAPREAAERIDALRELVEGVRGRVRAARRGGEEPAPSSDGEGEESGARAAAAGLGARDAAEQDGDDRPAPPESNEGGRDASTDPLEVGPVVALRAAKAVERLQAALGGWHRFRAGYEPDFDWWVARPHAALEEALRDLARHLRRDVAGLKGEDDDPLIGDPLGRAALERAIARELLPYSPEELIAIGERELAWCEERMAEAAAELGHDDWRAALEEVKGRTPPPGGHDELVRGQALDAIAFLDARELVTIEPLCRESWRLEMLGERTQRTLPYGAYGGQRMLVAAPTEDMDHGRKVMALRGNNEHFTRIVTPHELIPGHHLQGYMSQRHATHRRAFSTPFLVEGWCLHWEMLLWELGWPRGPEDRIGMLFWRMHRCARILVSLRFHLGETTPEEMIELLVERVGHERDGATAEVRRYVGEDYGPLYQCGYMIGGLQIRALYRELVEEGGWTPRAFHDAVLREGPIPIELLRAALAGAPLARDWTPSWRFAGD